MNRLLTVSLLSCSLVMSSAVLHAEDNVNPAGNAASTNTVAKAVKPQTTCPVTGETLTSKDVFVDVQGQRIYVCCASCISKIKANPKKFIRQMEEAGVTLDAAPAAPAPKK